MKNGINRENLQKLATFLAYGDLPKEIKFDMGLFTRGECRDRKTACETAGCAVGFAPFAGIPKFSTESWLDYSERTLIPPKTDIEWNWCFGEEWYDLDNTPLGAAKRIQYLLDGEKIPKHIYTDEDEEEYEDYTDLYNDVKVRQ